MQREMPVSPDDGIASDCPRPLNAKISGEMPPGLGSEVGIGDRSGCKIGLMGGYVFNESDVERCHLGRRGRCFVK